LIQAGSAYAMSFSGPPIPTLRTRCLSIDRNLAGPDPRLPTRPPAGSDLGGAFIHWLRFDPRVSNSECDRGTC
jgi:hypothetical protein